MPAPTVAAPAPEPDRTPALTGPVLLRRTLLVLTTTLLVARPLVLGEDPGLLDSLSDPWGMVLTLLWLAAAAGWAAWRFWLRPKTRPDGTIEETPDEGPPPWNWYGGIVQMALLATVGLVFLSAELAAHYKFPARLIAWEWFGLFITFFVVRQLAATPAEQRGLFAVLLAGAVSLAAQGIYQGFVELPRTRRLAEDPQAFRAAWAEEVGSEEANESFLERLRRRALENNIFGSYAHPNSYAGYLALWLPGLIGAAVVCRRTRAPNWQTILAAGCALLGGAALWLTHSRGAMLGLALAGLGVIVLLWRQTLRLHLILTLAGLLLLAGLGYGAWRSGLLTKGMDKSSNTVALRREYWRTTWQIIRERPWLGVGPGNFGANYTRVMPETAAEPIKDPHNFALEMWATSGVFALIALLAAIVAFFVRTVRWASGGCQPPDDAANRGLTPPARQRWDFYIGGMFGLLLGFVLRVNGASPNDIIAETWAAALRSVIWFAAYGLLERIEWTVRGRALALTAGVAALLVNLCVSGGIAFPSVAGPLWVAVALTLNARSLEPSRWLSRPGAAVILPVPILTAIVLCYSTYILYPVLSSDDLLREAMRVVAYFRGEGAKPPGERATAIWRNPAEYLRKKVVEPLSQAVRLTPDDARLQAQLAWWYGVLWEQKLLQTKTSDPDIARQAIAHAELAIRLDPEGSQGYLIQYYLRMRFGDRNDDVAKRGRNRDRLFILEKEEAARKQYEMAAQVLERCLPNDPTDAKLRYSLARAWFKAGDAQKGREQAEEARRLDEAAAPARKLTDRQREQVRKWLQTSSAG